MPTSKPRLNVTIDPSQHAMLLELGALQGRSAASFLREMLDAATPMLAALLPVYRAAAAQQALQPEVLQKAIRDALAGVEANRAQLDLLEHLAAVQPASANDQAASPGTAPSVAREAPGEAPSRRKAGA